MRPANAGRIDASLGHAGTFERVLATAVSAPGGGGAPPVPMEATSDAALFGPHGVSASERVRPSQI